ncbi:MAG: ParB/RepB/Spo0J family partition protein [Chloroflexi bacterium]|nr:ParB/RepB/Spo0J family partition protein [Chloroflexota bacterium]
MATPMLQVPRFWVPLEAVMFNRFQARDEGAYDVEAFASAEIVPLANQLPDTKGLLTVPTGRLVTAEGYAASDLVVLVQKRLMCMSYPNLDTSAAMYRAAWAKSGMKIELAFGHRRKEAFAWLRDNHPDYAYGFLPVDVKFLDDEALLRYCVTENFARKNLSLMEEVHQIEMVKGHLEATRSKRVTLEEVGAFVGRSRSRVSNLLALKDASDGLRTAVAEKVITGAVAEELGKLERMIPHINLERWMQEPTPRQFLAEVIEGSRRVTRDQVRAYVDGLGRSSLNPVPEAWLTDLLEGGEGTAVVSSKCGTCPAQVGGKCVNLPCWRLKRWLAGRKLAQELAPSRPMVGMKGHEVDVTILTGELGKLLNIYVDTTEAEAKQDPAIMVGVPHGYGVGLLVSRRQVQGLRPDYTDPAETLVYTYKGGVEALKEKMTTLGILLPEPAPALVAPTGEWSEGELRLRASLSESARQNVEEMAAQGKEWEPAAQRGRIPHESEGVDEAARKRLRTMNRGQAAEVAWEGVDFDRYAEMGKEIVSRLQGDVVGQLVADLSKFLFRSGSPVTLNWLDTFLRIGDMYTAEQVSLKAQGDWREELTRLVSHQIKRQLVKLGIGGGADVGKVAYFLMSLHTIPLTSYDKAVVVIAQAPQSRWWDKPQLSGRAYSAVQDGWILDWGAELLNDHTLPESIRADLCQVLGHWDMRPAKTLMEVFAELDGVSIGNGGDGAEGEGQEPIAAEAVSMPIFTLPAKHSPANKDLPVYDHVPANLATKLKLRRLGQKVSEEQAPVGVYVDHHKTAYELYEMQVTEEIVR